MAVENDPCYVIPKWLILTISWLYATRSLVWHAWFGCAFSFFFSGGGRSEGRV